MNIFFFTLKCIAISINFTKFEFLKYKIHEEMPPS